MKATVKINGVEVVLEGDVSEVTQTVRGLSEKPSATRAMNDAVAEVVREIRKGDPLGSRAPRGENRERVYQIIADHFPHSGGRQAYIQRKFKEVYGTHIAVSSLRHALNQLDEEKRIIRRGDDWRMPIIPKGWGSAAQQ